MDHTFLKVKIKQFMLSDAAELSQKPRVSKNIWKFKHRFFNSP
jgi:hypothetical protein